MVKIGKWKYYEDQGDDEEILHFAGPNGTEYDVAIDNNGETTIDSNFGTVYEGRNWIDYLYVAGVPINILEYASGMKLKKTLTMKALAKERREFVKSHSRSSK